MLFGSDAIFFVHADGHSAILTCHLEPKETPPCTSATAILPSTKPKRLVKLGRLPQPRKEHVLVATTTTGEALLFTLDDAESSALFAPQLRGMSSFLTSNTTEFLNHDLGANFTTAVAAAGVSILLMEELV